MEQERASQDIQIQVERTSKDVPDEPVLEPTDSATREERQSNKQRQSTSQETGSKDGAAVRSSQQISPPRLIRASVDPSLMEPTSDPENPKKKETTDATDASEEPQQQRRVEELFGKAVDRFIGILEVPIILFFGIILYLVDIGSDIWAAVVYFQEGHQVWGSLTISIAILSAVSWAAVSWSWWYYDHDKDRRPTYRRLRMLLAILLLDPLIR